MRINAFPLTVFISTAFLLASCSAITTSQKAVIQEFATSAKSYTDAPKALLTTYSDCLYKSAQMEAATSRDDVMIGQLDRASDDYLKRVKFNEDFTTTYLLLNKYFQALVDFINVDSTKEFKTNVATLGTGLDSLISKSKNVKNKHHPHRVRHDRRCFGTVYR